MKKIISLLLFSLLLINVQAYCAEKKAVSNSNDAAKQELKGFDDLEINDNMFTITDEQFEEAKDTTILPEEKMDFRTRVINSGYFTPETPSRTYIPLREESK